MKFRSFALSVPMIVSLALPVMAAQSAHTPDAASDTGSRKVRTKVSPDYPALARQLNVTGKVKLEVTISPDGRVTSTRTVGGSPLLVPPATEAVKKWRYEPGPKESTEIVEFNFSSKD